MKTERNIYQKNLYRLGMILTVLYAVDLLGLLFAWKWVGMKRPELNRTWMACENGIAILAGLAALYQSRHEKGQRAALVFTGVCFAASACLIVYDADGKLDSLIDISLFVIGLIFYLLLIACTQDRKWEKILRTAPLSLDLRIGAGNEFFDSLVMDPHLEINRNIVDAVNHFLETAVDSAPLKLYIHSAEKISAPLQETMMEVFRDHYADEERRINRFLENRFNRVIWLLIISVGALSLLNLATGRYTPGVVWTIVSNFAGFSLWQIGNTYFERSEAARELMRIRIAKNAWIEFL